MGALHTDRYARVKCHLNECDAVRRMIHADTVTLMLEPIRAGLLSEQANS